MSYFDRFIEPITEAFTPDIARKLTELRAKPAHQAEIDFLAGKANQGTLTAEEYLKYKRYIEAADIIAVFQAKARRFLADHARNHG